MNKRAEKYFEDEVRLTLKRLHAGMYPEQAQDNPMTWPEGIERLKDVVRHVNNYNWE